MNGMTQIMLWCFLLMPLLAACDQQNEQDRQDKSETVSEEQTLRGTRELVELGIGPGDSSPCKIVDVAMSEADWDSKAMFWLSLAAGNCSLPIDDVTSSMAYAALGDKDIAIKVEGDVLTLFQRTSGVKPSACCSLSRLTMHPLAEDTIWIARQRLRDLDSAMLIQATLRVSSVADGTERSGDALYDEYFDTVYWRGPNAPAPFETIEIEALKGQLTKHTLFSPELGETRYLTVYRPDTDQTGLPVIIMADNGSEGLAGTIEPLIQSGQIAPVILVGLQSGQDGIVEDRSAIGDNSELRTYDYVPDWNAQGRPPAAASRFDNHLAFVVDTVLPWVRDEFSATADPDMTVVTGWSNGGVFAFNSGLRRGDIFGQAWPMSLGRGGLIKRPEAMPQPWAVFRLSAGHYETGFMRATYETAQFLKEGGYEVDTHWYSAGHAVDQWEARFVENLRAVFSAED